MLLLVILVLSIGILALILLMWTRERMTEVGILISLGISQKAITRQIILENYIIGLPAFAVSLLVSLALSGTIGKLIGGMLQDIQLASYISPMHGGFCTDRRRNCHLYCSTAGINFDHAEKAERYPDRSQFITCKTEWRRSVCRYWRQRI